MALDPIKIRRIAAVIVRIDRLGKKRAKYKDSSEFKRAQQRNNLRVNLVSELIKLCLK